MTSRLVQPRKPGGKLGGGLGVKKLETKVDDTLFEQPPAAPEPVKPAAPVEAAADTASTQPSSSASSRFAYDTLTAPSAPSSSSTAAASAAQRGKDGHLTLGLSNDDFFRDPLSNRELTGRPGSGQYGGYGGAQMAGRSEPEAVAQKKFANAKAISSRWAGDILYTLRHRLKHRLAQQAATILWRNQDAVWGVDWLLSSNCCVERAVGRKLLYLACCVHHAGVERICKGILLLMSCRVLLCGHQHASAGVFQALQRPAWNVTLGTAHTSFCGAQQ